MTHRKYECKFVIMTAGQHQILERTECPVYMVHCTEWHNITCKVVQHLNTVDFDRRIKVMQFSEWRSCIDIH